MHPLILPAIIGGGSYVATAKYMTPQSGNYYRTANTPFMNVNPSQFTCVMWVNVLDGGGAHLWNTGQDSNSSKVLLEDAWSTNPTAGQNVINMKLIATSRNGQFYGTVPYSVHGIKAGEWFCLMISHINGSRWQLYANDTRIDGALTKFTIGNLGFASEGTNGNVSFGVSHSADPEAVGYYWSDFYAHTTSIDLSVESNRRLFLDSDGKPVDLGADGSNPTGTVPYYFNPGGDMANNLGTGIDITEVGSVGSAPTSPSD